MFIRKNNFSRNNSLCRLNVPGITNGTDISRGKSATHTCTESFVSWDSFEKKFGANSPDFDGSTRYLQYPDSGDWTLTARFTMEWYQKLDSGSYVASQVNVPWARYLSANYEQRCIYYNGRVYWDQISAGSSTTLAYAASGAVTAGQWEHYACTFDGSYHRVWRSGKVLAEGTTGTFGTSISADLRIGNYAESQTTKYFRGWIQNFQVHQNRCLYRREFTPPARLA